MLAVFSHSAQHPLGLPGPRANEATEKHHFGICFRGNSGYYYYKELPW